MFQRPQTDTFHKNISNIKIKPGAFSNPANFAAKLHSDENKKKNRYNPQSENLNPKDKYVDVGANNLRKIQASLFNEDEMHYHFTSMDAENEDLEEAFYEPDHVGLRPLEERSSNHQNLKSKNLHSQSEKHLDDSERNSKRGLKRQMSVKNFQKNHHQRSVEQNSMNNNSDIETKRNTQNSRSFYDIPSSRTNRNRDIYDENMDDNTLDYINRSRSIGKVAPRMEKMNSKTAETSLLNEEEREYSIIGSFEVLKRENNDLWRSVSELNIEIQKERNKNSLLENEVNILNNNIIEERARYEEEFVKISHEIMKFQNIQSLYIKEKKTSQSLEQQLNAKGKLIEDLSSFVR